VVSAEGRAVVAVQRRGYADAQAEPREVVVDHADRTVRPTFKIAAGELVRLDGLDLTGDGRTGKAWLQHLAPWRSGDPYDPEDVAELERRLLDTGVYDSVTVALAPPDKKTAEGLRPVVVSLAERKRRPLDLLQPSGPRRHACPGRPGLQHRQQGRGGPDPTALAQAAADPEGRYRRLPQLHRRL
jgi:translocation and assembly module TamA